MTTILLTVVTVIVLCCHRRPQSSDGRALLLPAGAALLSLGLGMVVMTTSSATIFGALGKDPSLTQRIPLWKALSEKVGERSVGGYGKDSFWLDERGASGDIWKEFGWRPRHAHNGYLDLSLELGLAGLGLVLLHAGTLSRAMSRARRSLGPGSLGPWLT